MKSILVVAFIVLSQSAFAGGASEKAVLQAAMQSHVESQLVNGAVLKLDLETGDIHELYPTETHPMILTMGENFVLCMTLNDKSGQKYLADYYLAPKEDSFVVIRTEINNRDALTALLASGVVRRMK